LETGKTDLLDKFISKKGRPFKAYLVAKDGKVGFEFEPRAPKTGKSTSKESKPAEPVVKLDFTGQEPLGKCPKCGGRIFQSVDQYLCERTQADGKRCTFKLDKIKNGQPIEIDQLQKLLNTRKTDLLSKFISRAGKPFAAWLVMSPKGKIEFEFPPREGEGDAGHAQ
jgi:DNA topoisomerase-3